MGSKKTHQHQLGRKRARSTLDTTSSSSPSSSSAISDDSTSSSSSSPLLSSDVCVVASGSSSDSTSSASSTDSSASQSPDARCYGCATKDRRIIRHLRTALQTGAHSPPPREWLRARGLKFCGAHDLVFRRYCLACRRERDDSPPPRTRTRRPRRALACSPNVPAVGASGTCYACGAIYTDIKGHVNAALRAGQRQHGTPPDDWLTRYALVYCSTHRAVTRRGCRRCRPAGSVSPARSPTPAHQGVSLVPFLRSEDAADRVREAIARCHVVRPRLSLPPGAASRAAAANAVRSVLQLANDGVASAAWCCPTCRGCCSSGAARLETAFAS